MTERARPRLMPPEPLEARVTPTAYVVASVVDGPVVADGVLTLREALTAAVTNAPAGDAPAGEGGPDAITFDLGPGRQTIAVSAALPALTGGGPLTIDGGTDSDAEVRLDGLEIPIGTIVHGIDIRGGRDITVRGLTVTRFTGAGVRVHGASNVQILDCVLGTRRDNATSQGNEWDGVLVSGASDVRVADGKLASNRRDGVRVLDGAAVSVLGTQIYDNGGRPIDRAGDGSAPLSGLSATLTPTGLRLRGTVTGVPGRTCRVEFLRPGTGQLLGGVEVAIRADGTGTFDVSGDALAGTVPAGAGVAATVTSLGRTSELSAEAVAVQTGATVAGRAFADRNGDGLVQPGEPGLAGALAYIDADGDRIPDPGEPSAATDADGAFTLVTLEDTSGPIRLALPAGVTGAFSTPAPAAGPFAGNVTVAGVLFGVTTGGGPVGGHVRGSVFDDVDRDGTRDPGETPLAGLTVYLDSNGNARLDAGEPTALTGADGAYAFTLVADEVARVRLVPPAGRTTSLGDYPPFTVTAGQVYSGVDIGVRPIDRTLLYGPTRVAVGAGAGGPPTVAVLDSSGRTLLKFDAFDAAFTGGVRVAQADVTGDGVPDLIAASGPGGPPEVRVFDGTSGARVGGFLAFELAFTGGVFVAAGDFDADGRADIVVSPDRGGGPRVRVVSGRTLTPLADFFGIDDPDFRGGARPAVGDLNADGAPDIALAAGFGGGPRVALFSGAGLRTGQTPPKLCADFFAFEPGLRNGTYVAAGDLDGDGYAELIAGGGPGGGPRVLALSGRELLGSNGTNLVPVANWFAGDPAKRGGVRVSVADLDGDGAAEVVTGPGTGDGSPVTAYRGSTVGATDPSAALRAGVLGGFAGGVFVG